MNTIPSSIFSLESKINYLHAFSVVASLENFLELNEDIQQAYLSGLSDLALQVKLEFQLLHANNEIKNTLATSS